MDTARNKTESLRHTHKLQEEDDIYRSGWQDQLSGGGLSSKPQPRKGLQSTQLL